MTAIQANATAFNPNNLNLTQVATYERTISAPVDRVWENVLDWEHLPWLHKTSFGYIEIDAAGDWGWRTWSNPEHTGHIELTRADAESYVARTYNEGEQVSEIWTTVTAAGDTTDITVEFHFPNVIEEKADSLKDAIVKLYTQLWDEDEAMMIERHRRLIEHRLEVRQVDLGTVDEVRSRLQTESFTFQVARREYQLREVAGEFVAHSTICPHLLGPLEDCPEEGGTLTCPWHGYRFDIATGNCVSPKTATCRLAPAPEIIVTDENIIARLGS